VDGPAQGSLVVTGIAELVTNDPAVGDGSPLGLLSNAAVIVDGGRVAWVGPAAAAPAADRRIDVGGRTVVPGFVDSHAHLVFAGDRSAEFAARMAVAATAAASDDTLRALLAGRVAEMRAQGTTTVEVKSGYGLSVDSEVRALRLAGEVTGETTFLGAHVVPAGTPRDNYLRAVTGAMLAACAPLARWIDVFCEPGSPHAFDGDEARAVLTAGAAAGLGLRVHGNQLAPGPGVALAVELEAASVDHCTHLEESDVDALAGGSTVATLLPGVEFSTRSPYPDARRLLAAGVTVALATDCNPGTCASSSMPWMIALAVREMEMTPAEALWAATAGGAVGQVDVAGPVDLADRPGVPVARTLDVGGT
jgi:imidazolonepropionase